MHKLVILILSIFLMTACASDEKITVTFNPSQETIAEMTSMTTSTTKETFNKNSNMNNKNLSEEYLLKIFEMNIDELETFLGDGFSVTETDYDFDEYFNGTLGFSIIYSLLNNSVTGINIYDENIFFLNINNLLNINEIQSILGDGTIEIQEEYNRTILTYYFDKYYIKIISNNINKNNNKNFIMINKY
jgi:hypothetical protein